MNCLFCTKFLNKNSELLEWYDVPIIETEDFVAVPALGQIVIGYLLIIPRVHVYSMAELKNGSRDKLIAFYNNLLKIQSRQFDSHILFEHGSSPIGTMEGASINHAHWHIVPGNWDLLANLNYDKVKFNTFEAFSISHLAKKSYLLLSRNNTCYNIINVKDVPSQFFRRLLAKAVGKTNKWNYVEFPFYMNIQQTYKLFKK